MGEFWTIGNLKKDAPQRYSSLKESLALIKMRKKGIRGQGGRHYLHPRMEK